MEKPETVEADFARMCGEVRAFALNHNLPLPTIVGGYAWRDAIARSVRGVAVNHDNMAFMGVAFRFGRFEQGRYFGE